MGLVQIPVFDEFTHEFGPSWKNLKWESAYSDGWELALLFWGSSLYVTAANKTKELCIVLMQVPVNKKWSTGVKSDKKGAP